MVGRLRETFAGGAGQAGGNSRQHADLHPPRQGLQGRELKRRGLLVLKGGLEGVASEREAASPPPGGDAFPARVREERRQAQPDDCELRRQAASQQLAVKGEGNRYVRLRRRRVASSQLHGSVYSLHQNRNAEGLGDMVERSQV